MPKPIPAPREEGMTATTASPLYWARYGKAGAEQLLILHGGPGADHCYLLPQMLRLGENYDLLFYDQRGGGRSKSDARIPVTWETHVEDLAAVIEEFRLDPLSIVGYSWGAMLALLYASSPDAVMPARLALISPAPLTRAHRQAFEAEFARRQRGPEIARMRDELASSGLRERDPAAHRQRNFEIGVAGYFADSTAASELTPFRVVARVQQSVWESLGEFDVISRVSGPKVPAFVIYGRDDPIPSASSVDAAHALGAELVVLDACGHVPYVEQQDRLFAALETFLEKTSPR